MSTQSKTISLIEAIINTIVGAVISLMLQIWLFPKMGIFVDIKTNILIITIFTTFSVVRSYLIRRFFNNHLHKLSGFIYNTDKTLILIGIIILWWIGVALETTGSIVYILQSLNLK